MYKNKNVFMIIILSILVIISGVSYAENEDHSKNKKVYMIVADKLTLQDIDNMNNLKGLALEGGTGLMNTKGANNANFVEGFLSINASARAYGTSSYPNSFNLKEKKLSLYKKRVGFIKDNEYAVGNIEINRILDTNLDKSYDAKIGALGDNIHKAGLKTAIFGNADSDEDFLRVGSLIPMDSRGLVDYGNVDDILLNDENYPYGIKTDYDKILKQIDEIKDYASLIVIDTGDLNRLDLYSSYLNDETFADHRKNILIEMDKFIGNLTQDVDENSMFIFISPTIENKVLKASKLAPVIIWGKTNTNSGVLKSSTTRRDAIVSNLDIAPTITEFLDAPNDDFIGNNITIEEAKDNLEYINNLDEQTNLTSILRGPYLKIYNVFIILAIIIASLYLIISKKHNKKYMKTIETLLIMVIALPLVLLIMPLFNIISMYIYVLISLGLLSGIILLTKLIFKKKHRIWALLIINTIVIILDMSTGSNLTKTSIIGYDPIIGARYFGIGNELVGVILSSMILTVSYLMNKYKNKLPLLLLPITIVVVGHPNLGANVGGTISVLFTSIIFMLLISDVKLNIKKIVMILGGILLVILSIGFLDIYLSPTPTHLGQTILMLIRKGPLSIMSVLIRKISVNIKLIGVSTWSKVLYTSLLSGVLILKSYSNRIRSIYNENKYLDMALISLISGSIVGFIMNDSGLLLAAISSMIMTVVLIYLTMMSIEETEEVEKQLVEVEDR